MPKVIMEAFVLMRIQALLLMSAITALLSGLAFYWLAPTGNVGVWLIGLLLLSSLLTVISAMLLLVKAARRSIEYSMNDSVSRHASKDEADSRG